MIFLDNLRIIELHDHRNTGISLMMIVFVFLGELKGKKNHCC